MSNLVAQETDYEMSEADVVKAQQEAAKIFKELEDSQSRAVMLWLSSYFRQWDFMARN